ncbi:MAG: hypothetical protein SWH61_05090 [Thermodesulfobacteriota bacterium]|nr:hypothetical protein [Thermodesulfobacteriota bacterium]
MTITTKPLQSVKKFYFLDYFLILLQSIEKQSQREGVFDVFKILKQKHRLGESKYKKLTEEREPLTERQQQRYRYTFKQVVEESKDYGLIEESNEGLLTLTDEGGRLLKDYEFHGEIKFNRSVFKLMEERYNAFRILLEFLYTANPSRSGVLIFPHYSPLELHFKRKNMQTTGDIVRYTEKLKEKLTDDINHYLKRLVNLDDKNEEILGKLIKDGVLPKKESDSFNSEDYNKITKRIRDFWITYFLKDLYRSPYTMSTFELWIYRARQIGIIHATEIYPTLNGKLVYPTSVIVEHTASPDFASIYQYNDGKHLFLHFPIQESFQEKFVEALYSGYVTLRRYYKNYFINLAALREIVCHNLKISSQLFEHYLNEAYRLNLIGELGIRISLEVDKLPEETNAMYLKHEPVMVDGSYRNIIAIDLAKGEENE